MYMHFTTQPPTQQTFFKYRDSNQARSYSPSRDLIVEDENLNSSVCRNEIYQSLGIMGGDLVRNKQELKQPIQPYVKKQKKVT